MNIESLKLVVDINNDGSYSPWEIWEAVKWAYQVPGNLVVEGLGHIPWLSSTLSIQASAATGYASLSGLLAVTLSLLFWISLAFAVLTLASPDEDMSDTSDISNYINQNTKDSSAYGETVAAETMPATLSSPSVALVRPRTHLPVSRAAYSVGGKKHRKWHRRMSAHSLLAHIK